MRKESKKKSVEILFSQGYLLLARTQNILPISDSPLLLGHPAVDGNGWEVLLHQELGQGNATLHRLHKYHHLCACVVCMRLEGCASMWVRERLRAGVLSNYTLLKEIFSPHHILPLLL